MRKRKPWKIIFIILLVLAISLGVFIYQQQYESSDLLVKVGEGLLDNAPEIFSGEPKEVRDLRKQAAERRRAAGLPGNDRWDQGKEEGILSYHL